MGVRKGMDNVDMPATALCAVGRLTVIYESLQCALPKLVLVYNDVSGGLMCGQRGRFAGVLNTLRYEIPEMRKALSMLVDDYD